MPDALYLDNGPIAKSGVFRTVMECLGVRVMTHVPAGSDRRRVTARSKGKVERPFRTVKEAHETLYHFHKPRTEAEANDWLMRFLDRYNDQPHRREPRSRIEDWIASLPEGGVRRMCSWDRFRAFAREAEVRKVGGDARVRIEGAFYEVDPDLAGEEVTLWWGLFDHQLFVEFGDRRFGPYTPSGGPIPLHRYRRPARSPVQRRADRIGELAAHLALPRAALSGASGAVLGPGAATAAVLPFPSRPFIDPDPYHQLAYADRLDALRGVSALLKRPLARLAEDDLAFVNALVDRTLDKAEIAAALQRRFFRKDPDLPEESPEC